MATDAWQGELPPYGPKFENLDNAAEYEILALDEVDNLYFEKGQYIAKAIRNEITGAYRFYPARINTLTKLGPWVIYEDKEQHKQTDISIENYGKVWTFLKKNNDKDHDKKKLEREEAAARRKANQMARASKDALRYAARPARSARLKANQNLREVDSSDKEGEEPSAQAKGDMVDPEPMFGVDGVEDGDTGAAVMAPSFHQVALDKVANEPKETIDAVM